MNLERKKQNLVSKPTGQKLEHESESVDLSSQHMKSEPSNEPQTQNGELQALKRKNFVTACKRTSFHAYFDYQERFQLVYLPTCVSISNSRHHDHKHETSIKEIESYAEELFKIETRSHTWTEALEVCCMCITSDQYLSANVLKGVVEIILNAHSDEYLDLTIDQLIDKCQEILALNFSMHPPCRLKIRQCYKDFLLTPMEHKKNTFTNREKFGYTEGIVKYCFNRLDYEVSIESKDEPLINKYENIPNEMKHNVKGLHWQKQNFEIFEVLNRQDRIERLMAVLESIIELLQFDLAIWNTRHTHNLSKQIMRSHKPLLAFVLWQKNVLCTGAVNNNCRQILRLFAYFVHLNYSEKYVNIMTLWFNTIVQTFYICETNSDSDYPNTGIYCNVFAKEFYKIIHVLPNESIIRILEQIKPTYMQHLIGSLHLKAMLHTNEDDVTKIFINYVKNEQWKIFNVGTTEIKVVKNRSKPIKPKKLLSRMSEICKAALLEPSTSFTDNMTAELTVCPKLDLSKITNNSEIYQSDIVHVFYITLQAYLDAYSVHFAQEILDHLNEELLQNPNSTESEKPEFGSYIVTENFIKKYRSIFQMLKELVLVLLEVKNNGQLPEIFRVFENIGLLSF